MSAAVNHWDPPMPPHVWGHGERFIASAREEARTRSLEIAVNECIAGSRREAAQMQASGSTRKRYIAFFEKLRTFP